MEFFLNLRSVDLNLLAIFDAIITEGNLTRASERIGMSQPAMSNALSRLRHLVKDDLFVRQGRGITPTVRALELAPLVREALSLIEEGLKPSAQFDPQIPRTFRVAGFDYDDIVILPALMAKLFEISPNLVVNARYGTADHLTTQLRTGEVDLVIDYVPLLSEDYSCETLLEDNLVAVVREGHPAVGSQLTLKQYLELKHVGIYNDRKLDFAFVDLALKKMGKERSFAVTVESNIAMCMLTMHTDMVATMSLRVANLMAERFNLRLLQLPVPIAPIPMYMIWHKSHEKASAHAWFREQIKQVCLAL